jgi:hypothetical protein
MSSSKRENIEQIPYEDNIGEVQKAVSEPRNRGTKKGSKCW